MVKILEKIKNKTNTDEEYNLLKKYLKKPNNYFGYAFKKPGKDYNSDYKKTKKGKKEIKKEKKYNQKLQRELFKNGFDRSETWNLDDTIARFILPRLIFFRKNLNGYPSDLSNKKWKKNLDKMIFSFKSCIKDDIIFNKEKEKEINKGLELFSKYFRNLWD